MPNNGAVPEHRHLRTILGATLVTLILSLLASPFFEHVRPREVPLAEAIRTGTAPRPPLTEATTIKSLSETAGFQVLVSYTDRGFEPRTPTIKQGETIRFTNNSSDTLFLLVNDATEYDIAPQQNIQIAFAEVGTYSYVGNASVGSITVK